MLISTLKEKVCKMSQFEENYSDIFYKHF